ncbi:hypothetical protein J6590_015103 [Homalodisca vitripennis]|nr:hypothetical protein J6590_015103 [Homalodisca vitripennis]
MASLICQGVLNGFTNLSCREPRTRCGGNASIRAIMRVIIRISIRSETELHLCLTNPDARSPSAQIASCSCRLRLPPRPRHSRLSHLMRIIVSRPYLAHYDRSTGFDPLPALLFWSPLFLIFDVSNDRFG